MPVEERNMKPTKTEGLECPNCSTVSDKSDLENVRGIDVSDQDFIAEDEIETLPREHGYRCENCSDAAPQHEWEEASMWQCSECDETYDDKEEAKECCK
jgi:hypothetical protein